MLIKNKIQYSYNDVAIKPIYTKKEHRNECDPYVTTKDGEMLPIFTAPMSCVVNEENFELFKSNKITPIMPRNINIDVRKKYSANGEWCAYSMTEFEDIFLSNSIFKTNDNKVLHICIDVANGHMECLCNLVKRGKKLYGNDGIVIMTGNIADKQSYYRLCDAGADYVRIGIGVGQGCTTWTNVGVGYGIASLIDKIASARKEHKETMGIRRSLNYRCENINNLAYIIADGGIRDYSHVNKALALGADFVMIGGILGTLLESAAPKYYNNLLGDVYYIKDVKEPKLVFEDEGVSLVSDSDGCWELYCDFYGMASKQGQVDMYGEKKHTSEGTKRKLRVKTTINKWSENMADFLRSAMIYTDTDRLYHKDRRTTPTIDSLTEDEREYGLYGCVCGIISVNQSNDINK